MTELATRRELSISVDLRLNNPKRSLECSKDMCVCLDIRPVVVACAHRFSQIAIDSAIFPEGTSGHQLDVLARKALWKDGLNYMVSVVLFLESSLCVHTGWN